MVVLIVEWLAIHSIKLYELEDSLPEDSQANQLPLSQVYEKTPDWLFALIFIVEGVAILVTWVLLLKLQRDSWLTPCLALIAGLHFFPLAKIIRHNSYYLLGLWTCGLAIASYTLAYHHIINPDMTTAVISYGCAVDTIADGIGVMAQTWKFVYPSKGIKK